MIVLGLSGATQHDPAACLVIDGKIIAMAEEERLIRIKRAPNQLPVRSTMYCLHEAGIRLDDVDCIAASWDPALDPGEDRYRHFVTWLFNEEPFRACRRPPVEFVGHHLAHAASSFFCSGYQEAAILVVDGAGEDVSTSIGVGRGNEIRLQQQFGISHSLGILYAFAAEHTGLGANNEGKLMGLAAYGEPKVVLDPIRLEPDGYRIELPGVKDLPLRELWAPLYGEWSSWMTERFGPANLAAYSWNAFGSRPQRRLELPKRMMDLAASVQEALTQSLIHLARIATRRYNTRRLVIAGGVGLNCSANGVIRQSGVVDELFVVPAAHDAGGALGAAMWVAAQSGSMLAFPGPFLGPCYADSAIIDLLKSAGARYFEPADIADYAAKLLASGRVVGWYQGRMEIGPRALGHRSILALPDSVEVRDRVNRLKGREMWRPLSPSVLSPAAPDLLVDSRPSPFMLSASPTTEKAQSLIPATLHVDGTARPQTVTPADGIYFELIKSVQSRTGIPALLNTSFNLEDEPIVCSPRDALRTFFLSDLDALVLGGFVIEKPTAR